MSVALVIIFGFLCLSIFMGIRAKKGRDMNLEQWTVGGRGFGTVLIFFLMAGEIYTTFSFLGASSWAYGKGGPALYILAYLTLNNVVYYWMLPPIWRYAKEQNLVSQSDFFESKYKSPYLGGLVAVIGVIAIIPYIVLQLKGLGIIVSEASYGMISPAVSIWIGAISVTAYVMISGIHGSAWTAVIKDILIFVIVVFIGIYIPLHYYGGIQPMFEAINTATPGFLTLPDTGLSITWFISTVIMTNFGAVMWPHGFSATYSAKSAEAIRRNTIINPLYTLMLLFIFFVGFAAIQNVPGLTGAQTDLALLRMSIKSFDPWFIGLIGAAGLLTALVPGSMLLMAAASSLSKNVYKVLVPSASDKQVSNLAKYLVPVLALTSVYFTFNGGDTIVTLLLMGYSFVTQLFPPVLFSLMKKNFVTKQGAAAGMIIGVAAVAYITISKSTVATLFPSLPQVVKDLNVGIVALIVNVVVMVVVSLLTRNLSSQSSANEQTQSA